MPPLPCLAASAWDRTSDSPSLMAMAGMNVKQMLAPVALGVVFAVPVAFYQAQQIKKERGEKAVRDRAEAAKAKQRVELRRCTALLATVDEHCAKYEMGKHCADPQCVLAIKAVVDAG